MTKICSKAQHIYSTLKLLSCEFPQSDDLVEWLRAKHLTLGVPPIKLLCGNFEDRKKLSCYLLGVVRR